MRLRSDGGAGGPVAPSADTLRPGAPRPPLGQPGADQDHRGRRQQPESAPRQPSRSQEPRLPRVHRQPAVEGGAEHECAEHHVAAPQPRLVRARDVGFEVIYQGIRLTPEQIVAAAVAEDVHCVGLSILSGSHMELVPQVVEGLREAGLEDVPVVVGGIVPDADAIAFADRYTYTNPDAITFADRDAYADTIAFAFAQPYARRLHRQGLYRNDLEKPNGIFVQFGRFLSRQWSILRSSGL